MKKFDSSIIRRENLQDDNKLIGREIKRVLKLQYPEIKFSITTNRYITIEVVEGDISVAEVSNVVGHFATYSKRHIQLDGATGCSYGIIDYTKTEQYKEEREAKNLKDYQEFKALQELEEAAKNTESVEEIATVQNELPDAEIITVQSMLTFKGVTKAVYSIINTWESADYNRVYDYVEGNICMLSQSIESGYIYADVKEITCSYHTEPHIIINFYTQDPIMLLDDDDNDGCINHVIIKIEESEAIITESKEIIIVQSETIAPEPTTPTTNESMDILQYKLAAPTTQNANSFISNSINLTTYNRVTIPSGVLYNLLDTKVLAPIEIVLKDDLILLSVENQDQEIYFIPLDLIDDNLISLNFKVSKFKNQKLFKNQKYFKIKSFQSGVKTPETPLTVENFHHLE